MILVTTQKPELLLLRIRAGYKNQADFAQAVGIGTNTLVKAEKHKQVRKKTAYAIVEVLNVGLRAHGFEPVTIHDIDWTIT